MWGNLYTSGPRLRRIKASCVQRGDCFHEKRMDGSRALRANIPMTSVSECRLLPAFFLSLSLALSLSRHHASFRIDGVYMRVFRPCLELERCWNVTSGDANRHAGTMGMSGARGCKGGLITLGPDPAEFVTPLLTQAWKGMTPCAADGSYVPPMGLSHIRPQVASSDERRARSGQ